MPSQLNRLGYVLGKGAFLRLLYRPSGVASTSCNLVVLNGMNVTYESDPKLLDMTEGDSLGEYFGHGVEGHMIRVDLRRRQDPVSIDALGLMVMWFDAVMIDIGTTGNCHVIYGMTRGPYNFNAPQIQNVTEGFSLAGGQMIGRNIPIPSAYRIETGMPNLSGYFRSGIAPPSGL